MRKLRYREAKCLTQFRNLLFYNVEIIRDKTKPESRNNISAEISLHCLTLASYYMLGSEAMAALEA